MRKACWKCETEFDFTKEDIFEKNHLQTTKEIINKKALVKRYLFKKNEYSGLVTYRIFEYLITERVVKCPACDEINSICQVRKELISSCEKKETIDEAGMFGPNGPSSMGEENALSYWESLSY